MELRICASVSNTDTGGPVLVDWPGGAGWLVIYPSSTFVGNAYFEFILRRAIIGGEEDLPIPQLTHINNSVIPAPGAAETYPITIPFSAPKGTIFPQPHLPGSADGYSNVTMSVITIADD